jgi:hypothetical protein
VALYCAIQKVFFGRDEGCAHIGGGGGVFVEQKVFAQVEFEKFIYGGVFSMLEGGRAAISVADHLSFKERR